jgi:transposase-like protein
MVSCIEKLTRRSIVMIQSVITHHCTKCNSINIVKNGTDYKGNQKFHCFDCDAYGTLEPQSRSYPEFVKEFVLRAYRERASMRGVERIFRIARQTLARWIIEKATALPDLADTLETAKADDVLELDELWSFVFKKSDKRWIWIALCRRTRQVVAYLIGDRSDKSCRELSSGLTVPDKPHN